MARTRVVVTGIGAVTPIGIGRGELWEGLCVGRSGFAQVVSFDASPFRTQVGAEVKGFDPATWLRRLDPAATGRASQMAIAAAHQALLDAELDLRQVPEGEAGVAMGTTSGEPNEVERFDDLYVSGRLDEVGSEFLRRYPCHTIAAHVASELDLCGPNFMLPTACAAGNYAIAAAYDAIRTGRAVVMLAGGSDSFSRITYTGFARLGAIAPEVCQPFDKNRKGMIPGEGAAVLVLESLEEARRRSARIYAEVVGYGLSCDAHHMTAAHPEGAARAMRMALESSGVTPRDVSYISAHGTGTPTNDKLETEAVKRVFGETAYRIPMSSIKSMLGHTMGAASAIEAAACALAVSEGIVPPTCHLEEADPECDLDYVAEGAREMSVEVAMNNAYAFGGTNASLLLRRIVEV